MRYDQCSNQPMSHSVRSDPWAGPHCRANRCDTAHRKMTPDRPDNQAVAGWMSPLWHPSEVYRTDTSEFPVDGISSLPMTEQARIKHTVRKSLGVLTIVSPAVTYLAKSKSMSRPVFPSPPAL